MRRARENFCSCDANADLVSYDWLWLAEWERKASERGNYSRFFKDSVKYRYSGSSIIFCNRREQIYGIGGASVFAGIFPVFHGFPARKLCKSPVFEGGFEKYLKIFYIIFTRFGGMTGKENQILWTMRKKP